MTISSTTNRVSYAGDGSTTVFPYPHRFLEDDDLLVIVVDDSTGVETEQTLDTDYTVSGAGDAGGGDVTFMSAPTSGKTIVILNDPDITQGYDPEDGSALAANSLETAFDRLTLINQRQSDQIGRAFRKSDGDTSGAATVLPVPIENRSFKYVSDGNGGLELGLTSHDPDEAQEDAEAAQTAAETAQSAAETAESNAEGHETAALAAESGAESSQTAAEDARDQALAATNLAGFFKTDSESVAWQKDGDFAVSTAQALRVVVDDTAHEIASGTSVSMPGSPTAGTDFAIWAATDGTLQADASFTSAPSANARLVGGFHYAPGGNAALDATGDWSNHTGGDTTPTINAYSMWDLKFRPAAPDPRGLTLVNRSFWCGIYHLVADHLAGPVHRNDADIAKDGQNPQKPYGDGSQYYSDSNWWNITEVLQYHGLRSMVAAEYQVAAIGTTEQASRGNDPLTTGLGTSNTGSSNTDEKFTSHWGCFQISGVVQMWGQDVLLEDGSVTTAYGSQGRGGRTGYKRAAYFGRDWGSGAESGSRASAASTVDSSFAGIGGRGVCDHLELA